MSIQANIRLILALGALSALPLLLTACANVDEQQDQQMDQPPPQEAPFEVAPRLDDPQTQIWIPGYWGMEHRMFVWVPGKIIARPYPTAVWASAHWVQHVYGWSFEQGHWE